MFGPDLFATLALAASIMAPALAPRTDWVGEIVFIKKPGTNGGQLLPDGNYKPAGRLRSIQYIAVKDEKGRIQVVQDGKPVWVDKEDLVRLKDAVEHYTKMLDEESKPIGNGHGCLVRVPRLGPVPPGTKGGSAQGLRGGDPAAARRPACGTATAG